MNPVARSSSAQEADGKSPPAGWTPERWALAIALVVGLQIALVFLFGEKKAPPPRAVGNVPELTFAPGDNELLALSDPTLFVLPHRQDFASATWLETPTTTQPSFLWTEAPRWLSFSPKGLGAAFGRLMQTDFFPQRRFNFKPQPQPTLPPFSLATVQNSTMQVEGELALRQWPSNIPLTNWPYADVLASSEVRILVNHFGNVISTILLKSSGYDPADQRALEIARTLRFRPAPDIVFGKIRFTWQTVAPSSTAQ